MLKILILGSAAGGGSPQWNCNSEVSKAKRRNRDYALLAHLGTAPRTTYLAKIRNQNPMLVSNSYNGSQH